MIVLIALISFSVSMSLMAQKANDQQVGQTFVQIMNVKAKLATILLSKTNELLTVRKTLLTKNTSTGQTAQFLATTDSLLVVLIEKNVENINAYLQCFDSPVFLEYSQKMDPTTLKKMKKEKETFAAIKSGIQTILQGIKAEQKSLAKI